MDWRAPDWRSPAIWRAVIGWSQLVGAIFGVLLIVADASNMETGAPFSSSAAAAAYFVTSGVAGVLLLGSRAGGVPLSMVIQALQVPWLWLPHLVYRTAAGLALVLSYTTAVGADGIVGATAAFQLRTSRAGDGVGFGLNLFALAALALLVIMRRRDRLTRDSGSAKPFHDRLT